MTNEKRDMEAEKFAEAAVNFCCGTMLLKLSPTDVVRTASKMSYNCGYDSGHAQGMEDAFRKVCEALKELPKDPKFYSHIATASDFSKWLIEHKDEILKG